MKVAALLICMALQCRVEATEPGALLRFVETISGRPHQNDSFAAQYKKQHPFRADEEESLKRFAAILFHSRLKPVAAQCADVDEFLRHAEELMPAEDFSVFKATLLQFKPAYEESVWKPSQQVLAKQKREFEEGIATELTPALEKVGRFFDSRLPGQKFTVELVPIPSLDPHHGSTSSESIDTLQIVEVLNTHTFADADAVVAHEFVHSLFHHRSPAVAAMMQRMALKENAVDAYHELNEAIATALGAGWYRERVRKKAADVQWYNEPYIQKFGLAIFPLVTEYVEAGRVIDPRFMREAFAKFRERVNANPDAPRFALSEVVVFGGKDVMRVTDDIQSAIPYAHSLEGEAIDSDKALQVYRRDPTVTAVFMLNSGELAKLQKFGILLPQHVQDRELIFQHLHGRLVLVCVAPDADAQRKLLLGWIGSAQ